MTQVPAILFGAGFTVAVCLAAGMLLLRALNIPLKRQERWIFAFLGGAALVELGVFCLGIAGLYYRPLLLAAGLAVLAAAWIFKAHRPAGEPLPPLPSRAGIAAAVAASAYAVLYFCYAMAPETSPDGSTYHLGLVARYLREHGMGRMPHHMYAHLSQGIEMLYLMAFAFGRHSAAALVHFAFLLMLPLAMLAYARRYGFAGAGLAASLFVFLSPVVGMDGSTAYNDVAVAAILFGLFYLLRIWWDEPSDRLLVLAGLLAGFAYAAKYTAGASAIPLVAVTVLARMARDRRFRPRPVLIVSACAVALMLPWMLRNLVWYDNPFSPFFNRWFPNPYIHISFEQAYGRQLRNYPGLESRWDIPLEVTARGGVLGGLLGPLFLLAPLGLLALRSREGRWLWLGAFFTGLPYAFNIGTRFLIPPLPFLALAMALVFVRFPRLTAGLVALHAVLSWPSMIPRYASPYAWRIDGLRWKAALRIEPEDAFLRRVFPGYTVARMVEEKVPPGERVLTFNQIPEAYTTRDILVVYQGAWNEVLGDMLWTPFNPAAQPVRHIRFRFAPQHMRRIRVVQTAGGAPDHWSIAEFRVFHGGEELPRRPEWRLRAHPNPWDVQRAFDNSPVTRWRSWQPLFAGMWVEIDFGRDEEADSVLLVCSPDQPSIRLRLEAAGEEGGWSEIPAEIEDRTVPPPPGMRRMVAEELKRAGVRYFLVHPNDYGKDDYRERPAAWRVSLLGEAFDIRLYRFD